MFEFCYDSKIRATPPYSKRNIFEQKKTINWSLSTQGNQPNLKKKFHRPDWYPLKFPNYKINCFSFYYFIQNDLNVYWSISTWKAENSHQKITLTRNKIKSREKPFKETTKYVELDDNIVIVLSVCIFWNNFHLQLSPTSCLKQCLGRKVKRFQYCEFQYNFWRELWERWGLFCSFFCSVLIATWCPSSFNAKLFRSIESFPHPIIIRNSCTFLF